MTRENQSTRRIPSPLPLCPPQIPYEMTWHWTQILTARGRRLTAWALARPCAEFRQTVLWQSIKIPYESTHSFYITDVTRVIAHLDKQETTGALKDRIHNLLSNFFMYSPLLNPRYTDKLCCSMTNKSAQNQQHIFFFVNYYLGENLYMICTSNEVYIYVKRIFSESRSQWPRGLRRRSAAARLLRLWVRIPPGAGCLSLVSVVCCHVEVCATSWSLVQRSPTYCGALLCVIYEGWNFNSGNYLFTTDTK